MRDLPERVFELIAASAISEFATVSARGVPIDTPTYYFPSDDLSTLDLATGLIKPSKAERARRNPKVGMLIEGAPSEPIVSIRGHAAVRDADFEANAVRYISETGFKQLSFGLDWREARKAVQYWTRIIIEVTPVRIMWWDNLEAIDGPPQVWNAPADTVPPPSDPAPSGQVTPGLWPARPWRELAQEAIAPGRQPHLTVCDTDGYPMPIRARSFELIGNGFRLRMPRGIPWRAVGAATLSFEGHMIFVGEAVQEGNTTLLKVERALPENISAKNPERVLQPDEEMNRMRQTRLEVELKRRGKPIPVIPLEEPPPTRLAKLRQARMAKRS
jgi:hypothetical protein